MRLALLALSSLVLACGTRTPLPDADQLGLCAEPFALSVNAFDLTGDEIIAATNAGIVALHKDRGSERAIVPRTSADHVATDGRTVVWYDSGGAHRVGIDGSLRRTIWSPVSWEESVAAVAIDRTGSIAVSVHARDGVTQVFRGDGRVSFAWLVGPPLAIRDGEIFVHGASHGGQADFKAQRLDEREPRVLLHDRWSELHVANTIRFTSDGAAWLRSGRSDVPPRFTNLTPRIERVAANGETSIVYLSPRASPLTFDVDDRALILGRIDDGLRVLELTPEGQFLRQIAWCRGPSSVVDLRIDARWVWALVADNKLYRFPRKAI